MDVDNKTTDVLVDRDLLYNRLTEIYEFQGNAEDAPTYAHQGYVVGFKAGLDLAMLALMEAPHAAP